MALIIDGTGFSYREVYPMKFYRGEEIRKIRAHVRLVFLVMLLESGKRVIVGVSGGSAYASEIRLLKRAMGDLAFEGLERVPVVADKGFDSVEVMEKFFEFGYFLAIGVRGSWRMGVKNEYRKRSERGYKEIGRRVRWLIESLFGTLKCKISRHFRVRLEEIAIKMGLAVAVLWNLYLSLEGDG